MSSVVSSFRSCFSAVAAADIAGDLFGAGFMATTAIAANSIAKTLDLFVSSFLLRCVCTRLSLVCCFSCFYSLVSLSPLLLLFSLLLSLYIYFSLLISSPFSRFLYVCVLVGGCSFSLSSLPPFPPVSVCAYWYMWCEFACVMTLSLFPSRARLCI